MGTTPTLREVSLRHDGKQVITAISIIKSRSLNEFGIGTA
jgi:chorismate-pyruvate lyase